VGVGITVSGVVLLLTFALFTALSPASNPYVDIIGYLIIPSLIVLGGILGVIGVFFRRRRIRKIDPTRKFRRFPRIDLNDPWQRRSATYVAGFILCLLPIVAVSGYHGYHYTDSVSFCAQACHEVMEPEAATFQFSAHARVTCAECHIGSGASWFVKAKISGMRQVLAVVTNSYSRPIPPAIQHLRPAADTCEQCHWPNKFYGAQLREIAHFATDEVNTRRDIRMLVKTGGGDEITGRVEGIHMHMLLSGRMEYVATDDRLQVIPWVKWTEHNGRELVYRSDGKAATDPPPEGQLRVVDCMDCHNRPAHKFNAPRVAVDNALGRERIDPSLPFIKREAVRALTAAYADNEAAMDGIEGAIKEFYATEHRSVWKENHDAVERAIAQIQEIYRRTFFPRMKVDWTTYPDNIGHLYSPGCFRCHDGKHANQYGDVISKDCHVCHDFLNPVDESAATFVQQGEFVHSFELKGIHAELLCHQCHTGGLLDRTCAGCHSAQQGLFSARDPLLVPFDAAPSPMAEAADCESCHDLTEAKPASREAVDRMCRACHEDEYAGTLETWAKSIEAAREKATAAVAQVRRAFAKTKQRGIENAEALEAWLDGREAVLRFLEKADPLHNPEASRSLYERIYEEAVERSPLLQ